MPRFSLPYVLALCVFVFALPSMLMAQETSQDSQSSQDAQVQSLQEGQGNQQRPPTPQEIEQSKPAKLFFGVDFGVHKSQKLYGFGFYQAKWRDKGDGFSPGIYANILTTLENERPIFYDHLTVNSFPRTSTIIESYPRITLLNFGLTYATSHNVILYGGLGLGLQRGRVELSDSSRTLGGANGNYSVPDASSDRTQVNVNLGAIIRVKRVGINIGMNSFTSKPYIGALWGF